MSLVSPEGTKPGDCRQVLMLLARKPQKQGTVDTFWLLGESWGSWGSLAGGPGGSWKSWESLGHFGPKMPEEVKGRGRSPPRRMNTLHREGWD